jgi:hypothetical protein
VNEKESIVQFNFSKDLSDSLRTGRSRMKIVIRALRSSGVMPVMKMGTIYLKKRVQVINSFKVSREFPFVKRKTYSCEEPWIGIFSINTNLDVTFCPCYLKMKIGNLDDASIAEIWNAEPLVAIRSSFQKGKLPKPCHGQLCPVALDQKL